jgi:hypothetical protein
VAPALRREIAGSCRRQLERRRQADDETRHHAEAAGERHAHPINRREERDRQPARRGQRRRAQNVRAPDGQQRPNRGARQRQDEILDEDQTNDARPPGPERQHHASLLTACGHAGEHEIGRVAGHRRQHQKHDALQQSERQHQRPLRTLRRLPLRQHVSVHAGIATRIVGGHRAQYLVQTSSRVGARHI